MDWRWRELISLIILCILGWKPSCIQGTTDPTDASALRVLYTSLNSPSQLTQWNANGDDPCGQSWKGITCSGSRVTEINLSGLGLSGSLGYQLGSMTSVTNLDVSSNNFGGEIVYNLPPNLKRLNLARNNFNKGIPYSVSLMTSLQYLNISHNQLQDPLNDVYGQLTSLSTLDLSFNAMSGNLPQSFSSLSSISTMYLQNNQYTGTIDVLATLPLNNLNVENNRFTGWIPEQLKNINLQTNGNSWNSGPAPPPPPGTPPATRRNRNQHSGGSPSNGGSSEGQKSGISGGGIAGIIISVLVVGAVVAFFLVKRRSKRSSTDIEKLDNQPLQPLKVTAAQETKSEETSSTFYPTSFDTSAAINLKPPPIDRHKSFDEDDFSKRAAVKKASAAAPINVKSYSIADLQIATGSFNVENLLGEGSFGRVYRAEFDDGKVLAVKKINSSALPRELSEDFTDIVSKVSQLHHPNITELVGYCLEHGQHLLVYEFHKNGSLYDLLHLSDEYNKPLIWNSRIKIALGTARALEYLHEVCSPSIVHRNVKSANILLDAELSPHLSDSGLESFVPNADQALDGSASSGYAAPEVTMSGQYTLQSDVYSFGVVMLELLTGRKPFDSSRARMEQSLVRWATPQLHDIDALTKMVDPELKGLYPVKSLSHNKRRGFNVQKLKMINLKMAPCSSLPVLSFNPIPKIIFKSSQISATEFSNQVIPGSNGISASKLLGKLTRRSLLRRLNAAGLSEIELDLNEDPVDRWETNSVSPEDFEYGVYDGHHTYFEGEKKGTFWGAIADDIAAVGPPTGFQGVISWLFLPAVAAGMYFNVPGEYLYIGAAIFTVVFCIIEMDKPDQPHNFEPQIYNMERGARDKLISDYNTMDIWEFNEKYGDLWDFTVKNDDITKT